MELTQSLHRAAQINPDGPAIVFGDRRRTWRDLHHRIGRAAGFLRNLGVCPDTKVVIISMNSDHFVECLYAVPWAGGVIVPINFRLQMPEIAYIVEHSDADVILFEQQFAAMADDLVRRIPRLARRVVLDADSSEVANAVSYEAGLAAAAPIPDARRGGEDVAALFYTGGTTGTPKGVMITHDNLFHFLLTFVMSEKIDSRLVHLHIVPMFHLSCIGVLMTTAVAGTHVILPKFDPDDALKAIAAHRVTHCLSVPVMFERMAFHPNVSRYDLSSLKMLGYGASPMPPRILEEARVKFPALQMAQGYGMTEAPGPVYLGPEYHTEESVRSGLTRAAGRSVPTCEIMIADENDREVPRGTVGQILIRGPVVMKGYWKNPELTAEALRGGWMHSGDAGYMDDNGFIFITDRIKDMIISGGENVYSTEVEAVASRHPAVDQCAIIGIPSAEWGEAVHAIVTLRAGLAVTPEDLIQFCKKTLAGYKCPRSVDIRSTPLPLSAAGKILKATLRAPYWADRQRKI